MAAESKKFSEKIVDKCIENPKLAFLLVPLGLVLVAWGISDARHYRLLADRPTQRMTDVTMESRPNDRGFTIPHVVGKLADKEVTIPISAKRARQLEIGNAMEIVETADNSGQYVLRSSVDGQTSSILFTIAGMPFNHIAILGLVITIGACAWGVFAKGKKDPAVA
jgi:hypothetical protein